MVKKTCKTCGAEKTIIEFPKTNNYYRNECKTCRSKKLKEYSKKYYIENKTIIDIRNKLNRDNNKEKIKEYNKEYYVKNKERVIDNVKKYQELNKEKVIKKQEEYNNKRRNNDKIFKLKTNIRNTINRSFTRKEYMKNKNTEKILGCDIDSFIKHILKTFKNNYGYEWDGKEIVHIDHIIPLATAHSEDEVIKLCHYTNLQLLKAKDNLLKGSKI